jgi:hypothetical protein
MSQQQISFIKDDRIYEMVYDRKKGKAEFAHITHEGCVAYSDKIETTSREVYFPYPADSYLIRSRMVLFPSSADEYGTDNDLILEIKKFIEKYIELGDFMKEIAPYYILLSWIYDDFYELPYLRVLGDYGTGKSRFLKVVGSLCYKPMFTIGATSDASIFRVIEQIKGTLVIDEADLKYSNSNDTLVQILNSGYQKEFPIYRCLDGKGNFDVRPYQVFGPKILAGRFPFQDIALESRCLVEKMGTMKRTDIPTNLSDNFNVEADIIRNKLLLWRLRNHGKREGKNFANDLSIEPRLKQIIYPLSAVIDNPATIEKLKCHIKAYSQELISDRGLSTESAILETIIVLIKNTTVQEDISLVQIVSTYNQGLHGERKMTSKKAGGIITKQLGLKTYRKSLGYILDVEQAKKELPHLCVKYGIDSEQMNVMNDFKGELEQMGLSVTK